jgi:hypothetical protein
MFLFLSRRLVDSLPLDPYDGILTIIAEIRRALSAVPEFGGDQAYQEGRQYRILQEASVLLRTYLEREGFAIRPPELPWDPAQLNEPQRKEAVGRFLRFLDRLQTDIEQQKLVGRGEYLQQAVEGLMGAGTHYAFTDAELARIQDSLSRLRGLVAIAGELNPAHAQRLVRQIERLRNEFRAITYDFSHFWGFVAEASLVFWSGKEDIRAIVAEIEQLVAFVWSAQAETLGRPGNIPFAFIGCHSRPTPPPPENPAASVTECGCAAD